MPPALSAEQQRALFRRISLRLLPLVIVSYLMAYIDRTNISFAALTMNKDLGFGPTVYGAGAGIFFIGYFLFEVPSNLILERVGARLWLARIAITDSGRYEHHVDHIRDVAKAAGLELAVLSEGFLRKEYGADVIGIFAVMKKT